MGRERKDRFGRPHKKALLLVCSREIRLSIELRRWESLRQKNKGVELVESGTDFFNQLPTPGPACC